MAYSNDYVTRNACDAITGWTSGTANSTAVVVNTVEQVQGTGCLELRASASITPPEVCYWYYDLAAGNRFKITQADLLMWFYYVKGKGQQYLTTSANAATLRVFFGGTTKYADYYQGGDDVLAFGWQVFTASGKAADAIGGTHNNGTDWDLDIFRIELRLEFNEHNTDGGATDPRPALFMDYWRSGTKITVSEGTVAIPIDFSGLQTYSDTNALGVVKITPGVPKVTLLCGLDVGNGLDGANNEGNLVDAGKTVIFQQLSEEVKHNLVVENYSSFQLGTLEVGVDDSYPVDGCELVLPANRYSDIDVKAGGSLKLYATKAYRWRNIYLGNGNTGQAAIDLRLVDIDSCETVYFRQTNITIDGVEIHDNAQQVRNHAAEITETPTSSRALRIYQNLEGIHFRDNADLFSLIASDNTNYDLGILEGKTFDLFNSEFAYAKMRRVAA